MNPTDEAALGDFTSTPAEDAEVAEYEREMSVETGPPDAPTCRCEPGRRHALCDLHGEQGTYITVTVRNFATGKANREADPYGIPAPEPRDPWLTHYDPFAHGRL